MKSVNDNFEKASELVSQMTIEEKVEMLMGVDFWHTKEIKRLGLKSIQVSDGPHGLRKEKRNDDKKVLASSYKATCFPLACATSCSFDRELLKELGNAIAKECLSEKIAVILGPGTNIKRNPLCGRNFEYFSEDPFLAGYLSASFIEGVQKNNVGVSLKHFFGNNQEKLRLVSNSIIDERAIREIYLKPFEIAIKKAKPATIMSSYNLVNSSYVGENKKYLTDLLRGEFGFNGLVVSDWAAINDRVASIKAGLDLEMPYSGREHFKLIINAYNKGLITIEEIDRCVTNIVSLVLATMDNKVESFDVEKHHELARKIARESAVLLKNDYGVLPFSKNEKIAVIGAFAKTSRFQGAGSSKINPIMINNPLDELDRQKINYDYEPGYNLSGDEINIQMIEEAKKIAKENKKVVIFVGLPDSFESEGFDRKTIDMPKSHNLLVEEVAKVNPNTVVIIYAGSVISIPWKDKVKGILLMNLSGQNNGGAFYDVAFGDYSPSGRLAETYVENLNDVPSSKYFGMQNPEYRESIFVGYRYYESASKKVAFPFGYGLSYSNFEYSNLIVDKKDMNSSDILKVSVNIKNVGKMKAKEVVQLYVSMIKSAIFRPLRELKGFEKIELLPNEEKKVVFYLDKESFSFYDLNSKKWSVESGKYLIQIGLSSHNIILENEVRVFSSDKILSKQDDYPSYYNLTEESMEITENEFEKLVEFKMPSKKKIKPYHLNSPFRDLKASFIGRIVYKKLCKMAPSLIGEIEGDLETFVDNTVGDMPLRGLAQSSGGMFSLTKAEGLVDFLNFKFIRGTIKLTKKVK